jgi:superfamily II DNA or RNA helicase/HKD family nuclease
MEGDRLIAAGEDDLCIWQRDGRLFTIRSRASITGWDVADTQLLAAMQRYASLARRSLRADHPEATIRTEQLDPPPSSATAPLVITVTAVTSWSQATWTNGSEIHDRALIRGEDDPLLAHLAACVPQAHSIDIAVAFVMDGGVRRLRPYLEELLERGGRLRLLTGDYMDATEPDGLESLLDLAGNRVLRVFQSRGRSFHPKSYIFHWRDKEGTAFVGSSNLSQTALGNGVEWNYRVISSRDESGFHSVRDAFEALFCHPSTVELTHAWVHDYRMRRRADAPQLAGVQPEVAPPPAPHGIQQEALQALQSAREAGDRAGLIVLATGLGKTWLSAFDSLAFHRVLFVAHREEILEQALRTFRRIRPDAALGRYMGAQRDKEADILFASVQTLSRAWHLRQFAPAHFDYIVIDEFHHAESPTYRRILEHFTPRFLLGLTATPERTDGADLLALCGNNLVYRCDLIDGVRQELLCPFEYYGVPDIIDYAQIPWSRTSFDEESLTRAAATETRARNALEQLEKRGGIRTLGFCVSQRHADFMRDFFVKHGKRAASVHSGDTSDPRVNSMEALRNGDLDIVFCVDMFNEGLDVPEIDTVLMLRPTESRILWLQQFGRGLRKAEGKVLRVIDYIGNHKTFLDKPRALFGALLGIGESAEALRSALLRARTGDLELPPGCSVTYDVEAIDVLEGLLPSRSNLEQLSDLYDEFRARHGRRPTARELHAMDGPSIRTAVQQHGSWFDLVKSKGDLSPQQAAVATAHEAFFHEVATGRMVRSYKMLVLQAMIEMAQMPGRVAIAELGARFEVIAARSPHLRDELAETLSRGTTLLSMLRSEPLRAWAGTKRGKGSDWFRLDEEHFETTFTVEEYDHETFLALLTELIEWRIAEHIDSLAPRFLECNVSRNETNPILFLPDRAAHPEIPLGPTRIKAEGELFTAKFAKIAVNVMHREDDSNTRNALPEVLTHWFGPDAGSPGRRNRVRLLFSGHGITMEPVFDKSQKVAVYRDDGTPLDAHFHVELTGRRAAVVYYSKYGTDPARGGRNLDYSVGLDTLFEHAKARRLRLVDALLDSEPSRHTPVNMRRLPVINLPMPLETEVVTDRESVRRWLQTAQRIISETGQSNSTRQIRLVFELPEAASVAEVREWLSGKA